MRVFTSAGGSIARQSFVVMFPPGCGSRRFRPPNAQPASSFRRPDRKLLWGAIDTRTDFGRSIGAQQLREHRQREERGKSPKQDARDAVACLRHAAEPEGAGDRRDHEKHKRPTERVGTPSHSLLQRRRAPGSFRLPADRNFAPPPGTGTCASCCQTERAGCSPDLLPREGRGEGPFTSFPGLADAMQERNASWDVDCCSGFSACRFRSFC